MLSLISVVFMSGASTHDRLRALKGQFRRWSTMITLAQEAMLASIAIWIVGMLKTTTK